MKFITRCIVEDGSNQRRGLLLGCFNNIYMQLFFLDIGLQAY